MGKRENAFQAFSLFLIFVEFRFYRSNENLPQLLVFFKQFHDMCVSAGSEFFGFWFAANCFPNLNVKQGFGSRVIKRFVFG